MKDILPYEKNTINNNYINPITCQNIRTPKIIVYRLSGFNNGPSMTTYPFGLILSNKASLKYPVVSIQYSLVKRKGKVYLVM